MSDIVTIAKTPVLPLAADYYKLRKEAMEYLQTIGSERWTDYNLHDPGISMLELLAYGITDLSYRQNMPVEDLLAIDIEGNIDNEDQALYTPAEILTINPWTVYDYRKLLIDIAGVKNAWIFPSLDPNQCSEPLYVDCKKSQLIYTPNGKALSYKGLYDVHLEFDDDYSLGDLNSGSITHRFSFSVATGPITDTYNGLIELRLPPFEELINNPAFQSLFNAGAVISQITGLPTVNGGNTYNTEIVVSANTQDFTDIDIINPQTLAIALKRSLYTSLTVHFSGGLPPVILENIPTKVFFYEANGRSNVSLADIKGAINDGSQAGIFARYITKLQKTRGVMSSVVEVLNDHRNLSEDYCKITTALTEDFAICCDIDADPDADLEKVQAEIYYAILSYMNPPLNFYSWEELVAQGFSIDEIFNGPRTESGYIIEKELVESEMRTSLYTSDMIEIMLDVEDVIAVRNFSIARIDDDGNTVEVEPWEISVSAGKLARFYQYGSKIQFFKNSLPFVTDFFELADSLAVIQASHEKPKLGKTDIDVPLPQGKLLRLSDYYPLMYSLPVVYNVSEAGPMPPFTPGRYAEAKQLKTYLLLFEQIYADWIAQIDGLKDFFNTADTTLPTYLTRQIVNGDLDDVSNLYKSGNVPYDQYITYANEEPGSRDFYDRKNRVYNHLLARLGENNRDYLLISNSLNNSLLQPPADVIAEKARLIKEYPDNSYYKARSVNYKTPTLTTVQEGVVGKLSTLLGLTPIWDLLTDTVQWHPVSLGHYQLKAVLNSPFGLLTLVFTDIRQFETPPTGLLNGAYYGEVLYGIRSLLDPVNLQINPISSNYFIPGGNQICELSGPVDLPTAKQAVAYLSRLFIGNLILPVEHILLRPRTLDESTLNICVPHNCVFCGDEDPYSFRMTVIMCGEDTFQGYNLDYRAYAEDLIRREVPAHIMIKICWLSQQECVDVYGLYMEYIRSWVDNSKNDTDRRTARINLVDRLNNMRSMYPPATLHDCADGNDGNRVFLGKTVI